MSSYCFQVKIVSRKAGSQVTRHAAYRAGEAIRHERSGRLANFSDRDDVLHKEILLPQTLADHPDMEWARDRSRLWNAVEARELRHDARLAVDCLLHLPPELNREQQRALAVGFGQALADRYRCAVDLCIHSPRPQADERNHHAHLLLTRREVGPQGLGERIALEFTKGERKARGLEETRETEIKGLRVLWAEKANAALAAAGRSERIDHRSFAERGIDREPELRLPAKIFYKERDDGKPSAIGNLLRAQHQERVEARRQGPEAYAQVLQRQKQERQQHRQERAQTRKPGKVAFGALTKEEKKEVERERAAAARRHPVKGAAIREREQRYYAEHREEICERARQWTLSHPQEAQEIQARYRERHRDELNRRARERYAAHREENNARSRQYYKTHAKELNRKARARRAENRGKSLASQRAGHRSHRDSTNLKTRLMRSAAGDRSMEKGRAKALTAERRRLLKYGRPRKPGRAADRALERLQSRDTARVRARRSKSAQRSRDRGQGHGFDHER